MNDEQDAPASEEEEKVAKAQGRDGGLNENDSDVAVEDVPWPAGVEEASE